MDTFCYFLGATAAVFLLVAAMRVVALRMYGTLLEGSAPRETWDCGVGGVYSGRVTELGFVSSGYKDRPSLLELSIACAAPVRMEANRRSLAFMVRKLVGVQSDGKTGVEELDRLFAFSFDERAKMEACTSRYEVREGLASLADLGAESVRLGEGLLTVRAPMRFIVPLGRSRVAEILAAMATVASAMESALPGEWGQTEVRMRRPSGAAIAGPVLVAIFFAATIAAVLLLGSFWDFDGRMPWWARLTLVYARLPTVALIVGATGFAAAFLYPRRAALLGVLLSWPVVLHAVLVWILYLVLHAVLHGFHIPEMEQALAGEAKFVRLVLTTASAVAAVVFASGFLGAFLGARASWGRAAR